MDSLVNPVLLSPMNALRIGAMLVIAGLIFYGVSRAVPAIVPAKGD